MSTYGPETRVRPAATWYLVTAVLWIAAIVLAVVAWKPVINLVQDGVSTVGAGSQISVPSDGLTVYATRQPSGGSCSLISPSGKSTSLSAFDSNVNWTLTTTNGVRFYGLGSTPSDLPAGSYKLTCTGLSQSAQLGTGRKIDIGDVTRVAILGVIVPLILGFVGLVVLIVLLVRRHTSKSRIKTAEAGRSSGFPDGWRTGGYPPPPPPPQT